MDAGPDGQWASAALTGVELSAPSLMRFEAVNIIRRHEAASLVTGDQAAQAHADLVDLAMEQWPYDALAPRVWELRHNLTAYDAGYVALAELLGITLVTLDHRIRPCTGPSLRCPHAVMGCW